jgi:hypothetical protein
VSRRGIGILFDFLRAVVTAFFQPLVLEERSGDMWKATVKIIKKRAMLTSHRTGSDPTFLHGRWLQTLRVKVQMLNANEVEICMRYRDAYHTRSTTRNAGASVRRACVGAAGADGKPPRARSLERAGGVRQFRY